MADREHDKTYPVELHDLVDGLVELPGDGNRLYLCMYLQYSPEGPGDITFVAIADDMATLHQRLMATGLEVVESGWKERFGDRISKNFVLNGHRVSNDDFGILSIVAANIAMLKIRDFAGLRQAALDAKVEVTPGIQGNTMG